MKDLLLTSLQRSNQALRVTNISIIAGTFLILIKFASGFWGNSSAMIADAIHSVSDLFSDFALIIAFIMVRKPQDDSHNYGHGKFETLSALFVGIILIFAGIGIARDGGEKIYDFFHGISHSSPGFLALAGAIISVVTKETLYVITMRAAKRLNSQALKANAWHHRSDSLTSIAVVIGIGLAIFLGDAWWVFDPMAAVFVSLFIIWVGIRIGKEAIDDLMEKSLGEEVHDKIIGLAEKIEGIHDPHNIRTRNIGKDVAIELHVRIDPDMTVEHAHDLVEEYEDVLSKEFGEASFITIHMEPKY